MTNVTVPEALKAAIEALEYVQNVSSFNYDRTLRLCKSALSDIEKCEADVEVTAQWVIDFIGSNYNSMRTHDDQGKELPHEQITYSLTVHDLLSAFAYTSPQPRDLVVPSNEVIDTLWHKATYESVAHSEPFTRYRFSELLIKQLNTKG